jgi:hypothetical protein
MSFTHAGHFHGMAPIICFSLAASHVHKDGLYKGTEINPFIINLPSGRPVIRLAIPERPRCFSVQSRVGTRPSIVSCHNWRPRSRDLPPLPLAEGGCRGHALLDADVFLLGVRTRLGLRHAP